MLFNILVYIFALVGVINSIHYPVKYLLASRAKSKEVDGPVNIIRGLLLPDPNENWDYVECSKEDIEIDHVKYKWKFKDFSLWQIRNGGSFIRVGKMEFVTTKETYLPVSNYCSAIADAYTERKMLKALES